MTKPIRVALLETAPADAPGSMVRFAHQVERAFESHAAIQIDRVKFAPLERQLKRYPAKLRMGAHHGTIAWNTFWLKKGSYDLFHVIDGSHAYLTQWLPPQKTLVTAHDIIPWLQMQGRFQQPAPGRVARWLILRSLKGLNRAQLVLADSECTARDIRSTNLVKAAIEVCPLALEPEFYQPAVTQLTRPPMIFHVGNNGFYKNRAGVVEIFAHIRKSVPAKLVLAGPPASASLRQRIADLGQTNDVSLLVDPSDAALFQLYREASLLLFPSYYEGFGWPPLEAMAAGCPVVSSQAGSLPEVIGEAPCAPPDDIQTLAALCVRILQDSAWRSALVEKGRQQAEKFRLEVLRDRLVEVYQRLAHQT